MNYERRAEPIVQFQKQLQDLPRVVENIQYLTASIGEKKPNEMLSELSLFNINLYNFIKFSNITKNK